MRRLTAAIPQARVVVLSGEDVRRLLSPELAVQVNGDAFAELATRGDKVQVPQRLLMSVEPTGATLFKPSRVPSDVIALKTISVRPQNAQASPPLPTTLGALMLFDDATGVPLALMDATVLTALRTAGGSGAITRRLARPDASHLVIFGAGLQAAAHAQIMLHVRPSIRSVVIVNRTRAAAEALVDALREEAAELGRGGEAPAGAVEFRALALADHDAVANAVRQAHIICTTTNATESLFDGALLGAGTHINAIGSYTPAMRELDAATVQRAATFSDCAPEDLAKYTGEFAGASAGAEAALRLGTIGQLLVSALDSELERQARTRDVTLFKSIGHSYQDLATARAVYRQALASGQASVVVGL